MAARPAAIVTGPSRDIGAADGPRASAIRTEGEQMTSTNERTSTRRAVLGTAGAVGFISPFAIASESPASAQERNSMSNFPFTRTDERELRSDDARLSERARALIRVGESGIATENPASLAAYFHPDFRFHGPAAELNREQLWRYFAACRAAFDDFTVTRQTILSDGGDHLAARTRFAGVFARPFTGLPDGPLKPNGKSFEYRPINIFRYAPNGQLIEEWVQYDVQGFVDQLRRT
jgi:predicted ester cyclase